MKIRAIQDLAAEWGASLVASLLVRHVVAEKLEHFQVGTVAAVGMRIKE